MCGSPGDALRLPLAQGIPSAGSQAGSALPGSEGMKERLCYLFPCKNQLLLNSFQQPSVPPPSLCVQRGLGLIHSLSLFGILRGGTAWLVPSSGSRGTQFMNLLLVQSQQSGARLTQNVLQKFPLCSFRVYQYLSCFPAAGGIYPTSSYQCSTESTAPGGVKYWNCHHILFQ